MIFAANMTWGNGAWASNLLTRCDTLRQKDRNDELLSRYTADAHAGKVVVGHSTRQASVSDEPVAEMSAIDIPPVDDLGVRLWVGMGGWICVGDATSHHDMENEHNTKVRSVVIRSIAIYADARLQAVCKCWKSLHISTTD